MCPPDPMAQCAQYSTLAESAPWRRNRPDRAAAERLRRGRRSVTARWNLGARDVTDNLHVPREEEFDSKQREIGQNKDKTPIGSSILCSRDPFAEELGNLGTKLKGKLSCANEGAVRIYRIQFHRSGSPGVRVKQCQPGPPRRPIDNLQKQQVRLGVYLRSDNGGTCAYNLGIPEQASEWKV